MCVPSQQQQKREKNICFLRARSTFQASKIEFLCLPVQFSTCEACVFFEKLHACQPEFPVLVLSLRKETTMTIM